jgi:ankyrin repeat protein
MATELSNDFNKMQLTADLNDAIIKKRETEIKILVDNVDINEGYNSITPLWASITGSSKCSDEYVGKGDYYITKYLLEKGANPNKQCQITKPVYIAVVEKNWEILSLLLNFGADPNGFKLIRINKDENNINICKCKLPLMLAIESTNLSIVEVLVDHGAIFNKETISRANKMVDIYKKDHKTSDPDNKNYNKYYDSKKIVEILEKRYEIENENQAKEFCKKNAFTGKFSNQFIGVHAL